MILYSATCPPSLSIPSKIIIRRYNHSFRILLVSGGVTYVGEQTSSLTGFDMLPNDQRLRKEYHSSRPCYNGGSVVLSSNVVDSCSRMVDDVSIVIKGRHINVVPIMIALLGVWEGCWARWHEIGNSNEGG